MKFILTILVLALAGSGLCERQPFERYQSIVDRQMFGMPPPGFDPMKPPSEVQKLSKAEQKELTQEQEKLQSSVHFSVIRVSPEGVTQVGFTDNSDPKAPRNYFLKVGETQDGWTVKEADAAEETTTIVKDDIEIELKIGDNSGKGGGKTTKAGGASAVTAGGRQPGGIRGGLLGRTGGADRMMSLRERRALRQQQEQAAKAEADAQAAEREAARQEQAAQEKAAREEERQEQRRQLMAIQEELRKAREARQNDQKPAEGGDGGNEAQ